MANELHLIALECKLLLVKFDVPLPSPIQEGLKISVVDFICLSLCFSLTCDQYIVSNFEDSFQSFQILVKFHLKNLWGWGDSEGHSVPAIAPPACLKDSKLTGFFVLFNLKKAFFQINFAEYLSF